MSKKILQMVRESKITANEAYKRIYEEKPSKGKYVQLRINIKENKVTSKFINALFFVPVPIWVAKPFIIKGLKKHNLDPNIYDVIKDYSGGTKIIVSNDEVKIRVRII